MHVLPRMLDTSKAPTVFNPPPSVFGYTGFLDFG